MLKVDLHLHTTASDGTDTPAALIEKLARLGFTHAAITDHDTCNGLAEALHAGDKFGVQVLPGIEMSADAGTEVHILGYGISKTRDVATLTDRLKREREWRVREMVNRLSSIGLDISAEEVLKAAAGTAGRAHIARLLVEKKVVPSVKEAFSLYLSPGRCAYIPREKLDAREAVAWLYRQGAVPVLAHPGLMDMSMAALKDLAQQLKRSGLKGIEAYHPGHTNRQHNRFCMLARELGLTITGGSDYHGENKQVEPGYGLDRWRTKDEDFMDLYHKIPIRNIKQDV